MGGCKCIAILSTQRLKRRGFGEGGNLICAPPPPISILAAACLARKRGWALPPDSRRAPPPLAGLLRRGPPSFRRASERASKHGSHRGAGAGTLPRLALPAALPTQLPAGEFARGGPSCKGSPRGVAGDLGGEGAREGGRAGTGSLSPCSRRLRRPGGPLLPCGGLGTHDRLLGVRQQATLCTWPEVGPIVVGKPAFPEEAFPKGIVKGPSLLRY